MFYYIIDVFLSQTQQKHPTETDGCFYDLEEDKKSII